LENEANKWLEFCRRHDLNLSLVLIDIDNLKQANDEHGHLVGDKILYDVSQIMKKELRANDVCVRWGGDEFVLLLPDTSVDQARILSERIRKSITEHNLKGPKINVTCSFGITSMTKGQSLEDMIHQADESMYVAKSEGKNKIV
jgi:diguanylate cyclase (GGDEF)-like protein